MTTEFNAHERIDAIVFDVIGTLVDEDATFAAAARTFAAERSTQEAQALHRRWAELLDHKMDEVVDGRTAWRPHAELVAEAGREAVAESGRAVTPTLAPILAGVDREYRAWPDVTEGMRALRQSQLVVGFSNGDLNSLAALARSNDLPWHAVLSTAAAKTFKPAEAAYQLVIDTLSLDPKRTLFVAAHTWDLRAAAKAGFRTAYVSRPLAERPRPGDQFDLRVDSILELATVLAPSAQPAAGHLP